MLHFATLRLTGFKSFVDPSELTIEPGLTGIVGPNGCGKSNLVEALRWLMGESSARQVRGEDMDDIIFSGTAARPPRNIAEVMVALDIDGEDLPPPFSGMQRIEVCRRIERSRGSTYRVNGRESRARDVQLLFADASTGARSTAMISQGQVGSLISAKPKERRHILEEAAGLTGLQVRRHEAELRLSAAEANLQRVEDVLAALATQAGHLRKQAQQAARYQTLCESIRETETRLLALRWRIADQARADAAAELVSTSAAADAAARAAEAAAAHQAEVTATLPGLHERAAEAQATLQRLTLEREAVAADERRVAEDIRGTRGRLEHTLADLDRERARLGDADAAIRQLAAEQECLSAAAHGEDEARERSVKALETATAELERIEGAVTAATAAAATEAAHRAALDRRRKELSERLARLEDRCRRAAEERAAMTAGADVRGQAEALTAAADAAMACLAAARHTLEDAERRLTVTRDAAEAANAIAGTAAAERAGLLAEAHALDALLGDTAGRAGTPLLDAVRPERGFEAALTAALGDDLLAPEAGETDTGWRALPPLTAVPALPAGTTPLADHVAAPPHLARRLALTAVLAEGDDGTRLQAGLHPGQRLVSTDGTLWRWDGLTARPEASATARLRQRQRRREIDDALDEVSARAESLAAMAAAASAAAAAAAAEERRCRAEARDAEHAWSRAATAAAAAQQRVAQRQAHEAALDAADAACAAERADLQALSDAASAESAALPAADLTTPHLAELRSELARARAAHTECQRTVDGMVRETSARRARLRALASEMATWRERQIAARRQIDTLEARQREIETDLTRLQSLPETLLERAETLSAAISAAGDKRRDTAARVGAAETARTEADRAWRTAEATLAAAIDARARAEMRLAESERTLGERAEEIVMATGDAPVRPAVVHAADADSEALRRRLDRLKRDRDILGPVNLRAQHEAEEVEAKVCALENERRDLEQAIAKLRRTIADLDRQGRERLLDRFAAVDGHFRALFERLFGGGRAELTLVDADDPLRAGLEIIASPPGKRPQTLSLLSGGEQALTALALAFAVFLTRPAPVCVLDEVDAPLDDANVDRFCSLLEDLAPTTGTRFLVITHHRLTMARMDRLFGVTMAERGVSQLVSVDLRRAEALRQTA